MGGTFADLLGSSADDIARKMLNVGDVHILPLNKENGITTHGGEEYRDKFFVILGFDDSGNVIGGVVVNSRLNHNLPSAINDYMLPIKRSDCDFLSHDSFVNCSKIVPANKNKFNVSTYRGTISVQILSTIKKTIIESPTIEKATLRAFGIVGEQNASHFFAPSVRNWLVREPGVLTCSQRGLS